MQNQNVCRVCCGNTGSLSIFDDNNGKQINVKIMLCCRNLSIVESDGLPTLICDVCLQELNVAYNFIQKCEASDKRLRLYEKAELKSELDVKEEIEYESKEEIKCVVNEDNINYYDDKFECSPHNINDFKTLLQPKTKCKETVKEIEKDKSTYQQSTKIQCPHYGQPHENHTYDKPYCCLSCDKKFKEKTGLKRHKERNHVKKRSRDFICESCGKAFFSKNDVKIHLRIHTGETPYACQECPMRFNQISAFVRHQKRHTGEKSCICPICSKKFCTKEELKMHKYVHTNEKKYSCSICNAPFKYRNNLKKHMQLHLHPNNYVCNQCGRTFSAKCNLKIHIERVHSSRSGYCDLCSKNVTNMETHMWKHSGERPLKCKLCSSSFFSLKALAHHESFRHKNREKHKCTYDGCMMAFPTKPMLDYHKAKIHETGIPFPCDRCSRGFYRKNDLARHKIGTHKERLGS